MLREYYIYICTYKMFGEASYASVRGNLGKACQNK